MGNIITQNEDNTSSSCSDYNSSLLLPYPEEQYNWSKTILGTGELSVVHCAKSIETGKQVAIKRISPKQLNHKRIKRIYKEANILTKLCDIEKKTERSTKFVNLVEGFIDHQGGMCLVTEKINGSELYQAIINNPNGLHENEAKIYIKQIFNAVNILHSNNICHLDLKLENIMYNKSSKKVNLIDFGFAEETTQIDIHSGKCIPRLLECYCGSLDYTAPEILYRKPFDGKRADVWSLGVLVFVLLTGKFPFASSKRQIIVNKIAQGKYSIPKYLSKDAASLIRHMLQKYPDNRSNITTLLKHPWLKTIES